MIHLFNIPAFIVILNRPKETIRESMVQNHLKCQTDESNIMFTSSLIQNTEHNIE